ncbi:MAG: hypothetical protein ACYDH5_02580, partial [Acidimicrobiales bacterium]
PSPAGAPVVVRLPPSADVVALAIETAGRATQRGGDALVMAPTRALVDEVALGLRLAGWPVAVVPEDWGAAAAGGRVVVGPRSAAWAPVERLGAVLVLDAGSPAYREQRAPYWNGREIAVERAHRTGAPVVLASPCPSLVVLQAGRLVAPSRVEERAGWPVVEVLDLSRDRSVGAVPERVIALAREEAARGGTAAIVVAHKGASRLLACAACGELARCETCDRLVSERETPLLTCPSCLTTRPKICLGCGFSRMRGIGPGLARVKKELEIALKAEVPVVTSEAAAPAAGAQAGAGTRGAEDLEGVVAGTTALFTRLRRARVVALLDFDRELAQPQFAAFEDALAVLAAAARLVGVRAAGGRLLVATRFPRHEVARAALQAEPERLASLEAERRRELRLPPFGALGRVSRGGAEEVAARLRGEAGVEVLPAPGGGYLVRAPDHLRLCDALARAAGTGCKARIEVDPPRP